MKEFVKITGKGKDSKQENYPRKGVWQTEGYL